jgi:hypothetical protein
MLPELSNDGHIVANVIIQPGTNTKPSVPMGPAITVRIHHGSYPTMDPTRVPATPVKVLFRSRDEGVTNAAVSGKFTLKIGSAVVEVNTQTNSEGEVTLMLPEGQLFDVECDGPEGLLCPKHPITVPSAPETGPTQPLTHGYSEKSSYTALDLRNFGTHIALLGDISSSMNNARTIEGTRLDVVKTTFHKLVNDVSTEGKQVCLAAWNHGQIWFRNGDYVHSQCIAEAHRWIDDLEANGSTKMKPVVEQAAHKQRITDVVTITDGEVEQHFRGQHFEAFSRQHPSIRFHFVGIGQDDYMQSLQQMAVYGSGLFVEEQ